MKSVKNFRYVEKTSAECNEYSYLAILHLSRVELHCKLQEKLHRVTWPLVTMIWFWYIEEVVAIDICCCRFHVTFAKMFRTSFQVCKFISKFQSFQVHKFTNWFDWLLSIHGSTRGLVYKPACEFQC